jgi:GWxTD domain-containing protein
MALLALAMLAAGAAPQARGDPSRPGRAESLYLSAQARLATGSFDQRRIAIGELEEATALASDEPRYQLALGRAYFDAELTNLAKGRFERAASLSPADPAPRLGIGEAWRRDWLTYLAPASLERAIENFTAATRLGPDLCDAWVRLAPLLYERGELKPALAAAERACASAPGRADAALAAAYLSYRSGSVARAESLFASAIPRLPLDLRARCADVSPLIRQEDEEELREQSPRMQAEFARRFWSENDPDPATPENEAQLEYWARIAHASLMFLDPTHPRWDMRAELYVRFGPPGSVAYEPLGVPLTRTPSWYHAWRYTRLNGWRRVGEPTDYPMHSMVWDYPNLGMLVLLNDYALSEHYQLPPSLYRPPDPLPSPQALSRGDFLFTAGGKAMFPLLPPGVRALPVAGHVCRFEGEHGARLLAQLEAPGTPVDSLWATCVVVDSSEHEVTRATRVLSPSGCDPTRLRTADFSFDVPPGFYRVGFSVRNERGDRGVTRSTKDVEPQPASLALSDVVVICGPIDVAPGAPEIRLAPDNGPRAPQAVAATAPVIRLGPNLRARVAGDEPLIAYFEIYHLLPGVNGQAPFEYEYTVRSEEKDARPWFRRMFPFGAHEPRVQVQGAEVNFGPLRRQFVSVPVASLPPGRYRLEVRVRDASTGETALGTARFERVKKDEAGG